MSTVVELQLINATNASLLERVDEDVFDNPVSPELVGAFVANPSNVLVAALEAGIVIGMASGIAYVHPDKPPQLFVNEVAVAARCQGRGIGKLLVTSPLRRGRELGCTEAWVATEEGNSRARALYTSAQGKEDPERAVVYTFSLLQPPSVASARG